MRTEPGSAAFLRRALAVGGVSVLLAVAAVAGGIGSAAAESAPAGSCAWFVPLNDNGANALYLDQNVSYWVTRLPYVPGSSVTVRGAFPHARYMSVTAYDPRTRAISSLYDSQLVPDPGSVNPFVAGADRNATARSYSLRVNFLQPGQQPPAGANQLSTGFTGDASPTAPPASDFFLVYRVYLPDHGTDRAGGVPLPEVAVNLPGGRTAFPACPAGFEPPADVSAQLAGFALPQAGAADNSGGDPSWHKFVNLGTSATHAPDASGKTDFSGKVGPYTMQTGQGGYLEDRENAYLFSFLNATSGPLTVIHAAALSYPDTSGGAPRMPGGATDVRYWSMCSYEPVTQRNLACAADHDAARGARSYTIVVSSPANRPADLCGATWIPFGPGVQSLLIFRNQLGTAPYTAQGVTPGQEASMGSYLPAARYMDSAGFSRQFCSSPGPGGSGNNGSGPGGNNGSGPGGNNGSGPGGADPSGNGSGGSFDYPMPPDIPGLLPTEYWGSGVPAPLLPPAPLKPPVDVVTEPGAVADAMAPAPDSIPAFQDAPVAVVSTPAPGSPWAGAAAGAAVIFSLAAVIRRKLAD